MKRQTILDKVVEALKTDTELTDSRSEMLDSAILHDPARLVQGWAPNEISGFRLVTPDGNFDITIAQVKPETAAARPG